MSLRGPLGPTPIEKQRKQAVQTVADRLSVLGHEVVPAEPPLGPMSASSSWSASYAAWRTTWRSCRTRSGWNHAPARIAALGRRVPDRVYARVRAAEAGLHEAMARFFGDFDVVLQPGWTTPQPRVGRFHGAGASHTLATVSMGIVFYPIWNVLGYPVAALPAGFDNAGLPMGVQLVGPAGSETAAVAGRPVRTRPPVEPRRPAL